MPEACGLASEWRMVTWGTHEGLQWAQQQHGVDIKELCTSIKNESVACTHEEKKQANGDDKV